MYQLGRRLKALYANSAEKRDEAIQKLTWCYPEVDEKGEPSAEAVLKEMNGYTVADRKQLDRFQKLKDDGSTAAGAWLYCGIFPDEKTNKSRSRVPDGPYGPGTHLDWAFSWPANRRNMYNRASADPEGRPWSERKRLMWWNAGEGKWNGYDFLDFEPTKPPDYEPDWSKDPKGMEAIDGRGAFIMIADGRASLFVPTGLKDGPLPAHYEPVELPVKNPMYGQQDNPVAKKWERADNIYHSSPDERYPYCLTTYRLTEHLFRRDSDTFGAGDSRTATGRLLRDPSGIGGRTRHRKFGLGDTRHGARRGRDARLGYRAAAALHHR